MTAVQTFSPDDAISYVSSHKELSRRFKKGANLKATDLADGNVNLVFRVKDPQSNDSVILKKAFPYAWRYPEFKMPLERAKIESEILKFYNQKVPELSPKLFFYDAAEAITVMEDLHDHIILRRGTIAQIEYPQLGENIGKFLAKTLYYTSDFYLSSAEKKSSVMKFMNPVLCKVQEDLVFTFPFVEHESNSATRGASEMLQNIQKNKVILSNALKAKILYMTKAESLLHGDFHTGSIMVKDASLKVIDPEFGFYGPMSYEVGKIIANLLIAVITQEGHSPKEKAQQYGFYLKNEIKNLYETFESEFQRLHENERQSDITPYLQTFMETLFKEAMLMAGCVIIRRTVGLAKVEDITSINDEDTKDEISIKLLSCASTLLTSHDLGSISDIFSFV